MQSLATPASPPSFLPDLMAQYVTGRLAEPSWQQISEALDASATSSLERIALAAFLNDAVRTTGPAALDLPDLSEIEDLLSAMR